MTRLIAAPKQALPLYHDLGVGSDASQADIHAAWLRICCQYHPDKAGENSTFKAARYAYSILSNPVKRHLYDESGVDPDSTHAGAIGMIVEIVVFVIEEHGAGDLLKQTLEHLKGVNAEAAKQILTCSTHNQKLEKACSEIEDRWSGTPEVVAKILLKLRTTIEENKQQIQNLEGKQTLIKAAQVLLSKSAYRAAVQPVNTADMDRLVKMLRTYESPPSGRYPF
jgi:hypothetical protein